MARNFSQSTINQMVECAEKYGTKVAAEKFNVSNSTIYYHTKKKGQMKQKSSLTL